MKSIFIFILFAVLNSNSFASAQFVAGNLNSNLPEPTPLTEPTIYDRIMEKFNNGTLPEFTSSIGWWSGRCYSPSSPSEPENMLLAVAENTIVENPNNGPDFPPVTKVVHNLAFIYSPRYTAPDIFDDMPSDLRSAVDSLVKSDDFMANPIHEANGSMYIESGIYRNTIRKFGENFYGHMSTMSGDQETITKACYFFKKVN